MLATKQVKTHKQKRLTSYSTSKNIQSFRLNQQLIRERNYPYKNQGRIHRERRTLGPFSWTTNTYFNTYQYYINTISIHINTIPIVCINQGCWTFHFTFLNVSILIAIDFYCLICDLEINRVAIYVRISWRSGLPKVSFLCNA